MENGAHKTLFLSGLIQISENFAYNPLKLCIFMIHSSLPTQEDFGIISHEYSVLSSRFHQPGLRKSTQNDLKQVGQKSAARQLDYFSNHMVSLNSD